MRSVKRNLSTVWTSFSSGLILFTFLAGLLASSQASAANITVDEYFCADDIKNVGNCVANEVSLSGVTGVTISDMDGNPLTSCFDGQTIMVTNMDAELDNNTGQRWDITFWIGRYGNDPRTPAGDDPTACAVTTLPDDGTGAPYIGDDDGDACWDFAVPPSPVPLSFGGGSATFECRDSNNDGIADLQILTTWQQNVNFVCGVGSLTPPFDINNPLFEPGSPSKCDITTLNTVPIVQVASLTITKVSQGGTDVFAFTPAGFPAGSAFENPFTLDTTAPTPGSDSLTDAAIVLSDPVNGDTFTVTEDALAGWNLIDASCSNGDDPTVGVTLMPNDDVTCTFTNVADGSVTIIKTAIGGDATFAYTSTTAPLAPGFNIMTVGGSGSSSTTGLAPDVYDVTETPLAGWDLTGLRCEDPDGGSGWDITTGEVTIDLDAGETITCFYENTKRGQIGLSKATTPASTDIFEFTHNVVGTTVPAPTFNVTTGTGVDFLEVVPGSYTITESDPTPGYDLNNIICVDGVGNVVDSSVDIPNRVATVNVDPGETVDCQFSNFQRGSLTVIKQLSALGPANMSFDFTSTALGPFTLTPTGVDLAGSDQNFFANLVSDPYDLAETDPTADGWELVSATCDDGTDLIDLNAANPGTVFLSEGQDLICTFINAPLGSSTIVKTAIGGNDTFNFSGTAQNGETNPMDGLTLTTSGGTDFMDFSYQLSPNGNPYTVTEDVISPPGWVLTNIQCSEDGTQDSTVDVPNATASINVDFAEAVTCEFTNTADASLVIEKVTVPAGLGDNFTFTSDGSTNWDGSGTTTTDLAHGGSDSQTGQPGLYMASESGQTNHFQLTDISCSGETLSTIQIGLGAPGFVLEDGDDFVEVDLAAGETVTCIFENTLLGSIQIVKNTIGGDGIFQFSSPELNGFQLDTANTDNTTFSGLLPGDYMIGEVVPQGWDLTDLSCVGETNTTYNFANPAVTVSLRDGENIVCTFTDTQRGNITLVKNLPNDDGGNAVETDFPAFIDNNPVPWGVPQEFVPGTYTARETTLAGYVASDWFNACAADGTVALGAGQNLTCEITNDDIAPQLTLIKSVDNGDGGNAQPDDFLPTVGGAVVVSGATNAYAANTALAIDETLLPGYTFVSITGDAKCPQVLGGTVTLDEGDDITCTISNDDIAPQLTLTKNVINDDFGTALPDDFLPTVGGAVVVSGAANAYAANTPLAINETLLTGYTFVSITGDAKCPQVLGGTVTMDEGDNIACTITNDDIPPVINLAKTVNGPAALQGNGTYTVVYTITATNSGGAGQYDLVDAFSPGTGITLNNATAVYVAGTENSQTGSLGAYPTFVTAEELATGLNESWTVTANFTVDPAALDPETSQCDPAQPVINTGFYNAVLGSVTDTDLTDNETCTSLPEPGINLAKTVNGPAVLQGDGSYNVEYTITATNSGGPGSYDLVDTFSPGTGITLNVDASTPALVYGGEETQTGTLMAPPLANGAAWVTDEGLAEGKSETWTVSANFTVDAAKLDPATSMCDPGTPVIFTGFYNAVVGSDTDTDQTDNDTCTGLLEPGINLAKTVNGPAERQPGGTYLVEYTITATNTGGPGMYDLLDAFTPGVGITLDSATAVYLPGTENSQTGTLGTYPNFVTDEALAEGLDESWTVSATFSVDLTLVTAEGSDCDDTNAGGENTGFTNGVSGSSTDTDDTDNTACTEFNPPAISLDKSSDLPTYSIVGEVLNYSYLITNLGPDVLDPGVSSVVDDQETVTCPAPVPLLVGETVTCTASRTITQADLNAGSLTNLATATVDDVVSNEDELTVTAVILQPEIPVPTLDWRGLLVLLLLMLATGWYFRPADMRRF